MYYVLDRIENADAILLDDNNTVYTVPVTSLQGGSAEGTVYVFVNGRYSADEAETCRRRTATATRFKKLFK